MAEFSVTGESIAREQQKRTTIFKEVGPGDRPRSCAELLAELTTPARVDARGLHFDGADGRDVYNITAPFSWNGETLLIGRVERRETEFSKIVFFEKAEQDRWIPRFTHIDFDGLQDPCITWAGNDLVVGGVRYPVSLDDGRTGYRMDFYRGRSPETLRFCFRGPPGMKDIRFKQLPDGRVATFSRPQGVVGGLGEIGFAIASSWDEITPEFITSAPLFKDQIQKQEWGGVNEVHVLANGRLGVLGHIACFDAQRNRHYYPMAFTVDPASRERTAIRIIAQRSFFPPGDAKRPDLADVVFSGGIVRNSHGVIHLYAGISDVAAAVVELPDPFVEFET
jgi:hypothetical protein